MDMDVFDFDADNDSDFVSTSNPKILACFISQDFQHQQ